MRCFFLQLISSPKLASLACVSLKRLEKHSLHLLEIHSCYVGVCVLFFFSSFCSKPSIRVSKHSFFVSSLMYYYVFSSFIPLIRFITSLLLPLLEALFFWLWWLKLQYSNVIFLCYKNLKIGKGNSFIVLLPGFVRKYKEGYFLGPL